MALTPAARNDVDQITREFLTLAASRSLDEFRTERYHVTYEAGKWGVSADVEEDGEDDIGKFPHKLGPFAVARANMKLKVLGASGMYEVEFSGALQSLNQRGIAEFGSVSPAHPITLDSAARAAALIPQQAKWFVWAYPLAGVAQQSSQARKRFDMSNPAICFAALGGYVYLDGESLEEARVVGCNAIAPGKGLAFGSRQRWRSEFTTALWREGRFQPITIADFRAKGARHYCWLRPGEVLQAISDDQKSPVRASGSAAAAAASPAPAAAAAAAPAAAPADAAAAPAPTRRSAKGSLIAERSAKFSAPAAPPAQLKRGPSRAEVPEPPDEDPHTAPTPSATWSAWPHGGFAYLFHEDPSVHDDRDCFFAIVGSDEEPELRMLPRQADGTVAFTSFALTRQGGKTKLEKRVQELEDQFICCICFEDTRSCLFSPCSHMAACMKCSLTLTSCPMCRKAIAAKISVFK